MSRYFALGESCGDIYALRCREGRGTRLNMPRTESVVAQSPFLCKLLPRYGEDEAVVSAFLGCLGDSSYICCRVS